MCQKGVQHVTWKMCGRHFMEICAKVSAGQYYYTTILKPFGVLGCKQIGKETLATATRFWSLWILELLRSFCIVNVRQKSPEFCGGNGCQTVPFYPKSFENWCKLKSTSCNKLASVTYKAECPVIKMLVFLMGGKNFCWKSSLVFKSIFVPFWGLSAYYFMQQMFVNKTKSQMLIFVNLPFYGMLQCQVALATRQQGFCPVWNFTLKAMFASEEFM